jgi:hypothetical protein
MVFQRVLMNEAGDGVVFRTIAQVRTREPIVVYSPLKELTRDR